MIGLKQFLALSISMSGIIAFSPSVTADTLYVSQASTLGPGHPLRLVNDHRASQVGDLLAVEFIYQVSSSSALTNSAKKGADLALGAGVGLARLPFFQFPTGYNSSSDSTSSHQKNDTSSFTTTMTATVTDVLPSGALVVAGDQDVFIDGQKHLFHVKGVVRPEDIDNTDTVLSSRIANIQANFDGDYKGDHHGLIQKVLDVLF